MIVAQAGWSADLTLNALSRGNYNDLLEPDNVTLSRDPVDGPAFVVYCNALTAASTSVTDPSLAAVDSFALGQISDNRATAGDGFEGGSLWTDYEQGIYLSMRSVRPQKPAEDVLKTVYADLYRVLWRLFVSPSKLGAADDPSARVDWMSLSDRDSSQFDYSHGHL